MTREATASVGGSSRTDAGTNRVNSTGTDALGGQEAVIARTETFLLGLSDIGLLALVVAILGLLTVVHYGLV